MEWLITLGVGLAAIAGIAMAIFTAACVHAFCTDHEFSPWWMKAIGCVATLLAVALIFGALVRFS